MTDTKIPMRIFTSYEALTEYYGERPDMELGLYVSDEKLLVGHAPTAYSFNPQYFTGENELEPNYVPASPIDYTINVAPNDTTYGYATGGGTYPEHTEITLNAYAYYGYKFDKWSNGVETSAYTFAVGEDADLTAYFVDNTYTVTIHEPASELITTTGAGVYIAGTSVTVTATPAEGYYFAGWLDLDTTYFTTDTTYTFIIDRNTNFQASVAPYFTVSATPNNSDYGSTTGSGNQYKYGDSVTVTATPNENYRFVNWTNNGTEVSTDAEYTFTVYDDTALVANFELITYTVTVSANDSSYGTVTGGGEYARGSNVTINAIPNSGYNFVNWTQGGIQVVTHPEYTFTILSDADFVANFENPYLEPFYVENITNENETLSIAKNKDAANTLTIEYSTNRVIWNTLGTTSTTAITRTITPGEKLYLRCNTTRWSFGPSYNNSAYNNITGVSNVGGNIMSLLYGSSFTGAETTLPGSGTNSFLTFNSLFINNTTLQSAEKLLLPATTLTNYCYQYMFQGCTALIKAPLTLPGTSLPSACYQDMFYGCTSLTTAPEILATYGENGCCQRMFHGCSSLVKAPSTLPSNLSGTYVFGNMFQNCTSLTTAPVLPAAIPPQNSYDRMFSGCIKLSYIKCLATDISASNLTNYWVYNVSASGTFVKAAGVDWSGKPLYQGIPSGWTVEEV